MVASTLVGQFWRKLWGWHRLGLHCRQIVLLPAHPVDTTAARRGRRLNAAVRNLLGIDYDVTPSLRRRSRLARGGRAGTGPSGSRRSSRAIRACWPVLADLGCCCDVRVRDADQDQERES